MRLSSSDHLLLSLGAQSISVGGRSREDGGRGPEGGVQAACVHGGCSHTVGGGGGHTPLLPLLQPPESIAFRLSSLPIGCPGYLL